MSVKEYSCLIQILDSDLPIIFFRLLQLMILMKPFKDKNAFQ